MEGRYARSPFFALVRYELRSLALLGIVFVLMYGGLLLLLPFLAPPNQGLAVAWIALPLPLWLSAASLPSEERRSVRSNTLGALPVDPSTRWWAKLLVLAAVGSSHFALCFALVWFSSFELSGPGNPGQLQEYIERTWFWLGLPSGVLIFALSSLTGRQVPSILFGLLGAILELAIRLAITFRTREESLNFAIITLLSISACCVLSRAAYLWREDPHFRLTVFTESLRTEVMDSAWKVLQALQARSAVVVRSLPRSAQKRITPARAKSVDTWYGRSPFIAFLRYELRSLAKTLVVLLVAYIALLWLAGGVSSEHRGAVLLALSAPVPMWLSAAALFTEERRSNRSATLELLPVDPQTRWWAKFAAMMAVAVLHLAAIATIAAAYDLALQQRLQNVQSIIFGWTWIGAPAGFVVFAVAPITRQPMVAVLLGLLGAIFEYKIRSTLFHRQSADFWPVSLAISGTSEYLLLLMSHELFLLKVVARSSTSRTILPLRKGTLGLLLAGIGMSGLLSCSNKQRNPCVEDILFEENNDCGYAIQLREEELERNARGEVREGRREGVWQFRHSNGRVALQGSYSRGEKEGAWCRWSDDGILAERTYYSRGAREGPSIHFDHCGREIARGAYRADRLLGRWTVQPPDYWGIPGSYVVEYDLQGRRVQ